MTVPALSPTVHRFVDALHALEAGGDTQPLATLVAPSAEVLSIDGLGPRHGPEGMTDLFTQYRAQFEHVETTFTRITDYDTGATLEWSSDAVLPEGRPVTYTGVTILDYADETITRFRTLYDSGALLRPHAPAQQVQDTTPLTAAATTSDTEDQDGADQGADPVVGRYGADSGFLPEADRAAATGRDR